MFRCREGVLPFADCAVHLSDVLNARLGVPRLLSQMGPSNVSRTALSVSVGRLIDIVSKMMAMYRWVFLWALVMGPLSFWWGLFYRPLFFIWYVMDGT